MFNRRAEALLDATSALHLARLAWATLVHALTNCRLTPLIRLMRKNQQSFELQLFATRVVRERFPFTERLTRQVLVTRRLRDGYMRERFPFMERLTRQVLVTRRLRDGYVTVT